MKEVTCFKAGRKTVFAVILSVIASLLAPIARAEVSLPEVSAVYGKVTSVDDDLVITIRTGDNIISEVETFAALVANNNISPAVLRVILQGRDVFCFLSSQPLTDDPIHLSRCYVGFEQWPNFQENTNFISLSHLLCEVAE